MLTGNRQATLSDPAGELDSVDDGDDPSLDAGREQPLTDATDDAPPDSADAAVTADEAGSDDLACGCR